MVNLLRSKVGGVIYNMTCGLYFNSIIKEKIGSARSLILVINRIQFVTFIDLFSSSLFTCSSVRSNMSGVIMCIGSLCCMRHYKA